MHQIFVFGTLKEGFPNHKTNSDRRLPGAFRTKNRYPLYLVGERFSPWLILDEGRGHNIKGQVFLLSDKALAAMDQLERIAEPDGYRRIELIAVSQESGEELTAYAYGKSVEQLGHADIRLELSDEYTLEHAALYQSRDP